MHQEITEQFVEHHIDNSYLLMPSAQVMAYPSTCPDGRNNLLGWTAFGGSSARRLRHIQIAERLLGTTLDTKMVVSANDQMARLRPITHLHFDEHVLEHLAELVRRDNIFFRAAQMRHEHDFDRVERLLVSPATLSLPDRWRLAGVISEMENVGCGHWSLLLGFAADMNVRPELVRDLYQAILINAWSQPELNQLAVYRGAHTECAIAQVYSDKEGYLPVVRPRVGDVELFITTPQAVDAAIVESLERIRQVFGSEINGTYVTQLRELTQLHEKITLERLGAAQGLPVFDVHVTDTTVKATFVGVNGEKLI